MLWLVGVFCFRLIYAPLVEFMEWTVLKLLHYPRALHDLSLLQILGFNGGTIAEELGVST